MPHNPLENIDANELKRVAEQSGARTVKREYIKLGYEYPFSIYGVVTRRETQVSEYRRIEILSNTSYTLALFIDLYEFFALVIPPAKYSIWTYDEKSNTIHVVGVYE